MLFASFVRAEFLRRPAADGSHIPDGSHRIALTGFVKTKNNLGNKSSRGNLSHNEDVVTLRVGRQRYIYPKADARLAIVFPLAFVFARERIE